MIRSLAMASLALAACGTASGPCGPTSGRVVHVRDGDTVVLDDGEVIRYLGVDTPEHDACYGSNAAQANAELVAGANVRLDDDVRCRDIYDRRLAYVAVDDTDVGAWLLERGDARLDIIPPNEARSDSYRRLADAARAAGRGLWSACR